MLKSPDEITVMLEPSVRYHLAVGREGNNQHCRLIASSVLDRVVQSMSAVVTSAAWETLTLSDHVATVFTSLST